jgi:hypothetical protein
MQHTIHLAATSRITDWATTSPAHAQFVTTCINRHLRRDWGDLDPHDWAVNDRAVACHAGRILSAYTVPTELDPIDRTVWIITDDLHDPDSATTVLWPSDY